MLILAQEAYEMEHDILFENPFFPKYSLTITVRAGDEWKKAEVNDTLYVKKTPRGKVLRTATVVANAYLPFNLLPDSWIHCEHEPESRTQMGLFHALQKIYGEFTLKSYVTVLFFVMNT